MTTITTAATVTRKPLYSSLFFQVLTALVLGIVLVMAVPDFAIGLKILSDAFLKLISMIVAPIVFCVVVHGIAGAGDLKKVGRVGVKALIYFEVMTTLALVVGLLLAYLFGPGHLVRCAVAQRRAAGIVLCDPVRHRPGAGRWRKGRENQRTDRRGFDRAVPRYGSDRARCSTRRARRGGLY